VVNVWEKKNLFAIIVIVAANVIIAMGLEKKGNKHLYEKIKVC
jgi:hypothetical protein